MDYSNELKELEAKTKIVSTISLGVIDAPAVSTVVDDGSLVIGLPINYPNANIVEALKTHELGHFLFGHFDEHNKDGCARLLQASLHNLSPEFLEKWDWKQLEPVLSTLIRGIENIVMDFEVNSKLLLNLRPEMDADDLTSGGMWPEDCGYPNELDWVEYITQVLKNPESLLEYWLNDLKNQMNKPENSNKSLSKMIEEAVDKMDAFVPQEGDAGKVPMPENIKEKKAKEAKERAEEAKQKAKGKGRDYGATDTGDTLEITATTDAELAKGIKYLFKKRYETKRTMTRDTLMTMKRGLSDVVKPVMRRDVANEKNFSDYVILLDVSGSVEEEMVLKFIDIYRKVMKSYNCRASLISYNSHVVEHFKNINEVTKIRCGGGTDCESALKYAKEVYPGRRVIIVSDFEDDFNLYHYAKSFKSFDALNWGSKSSVDYCCHASKKLFTSIVNTQER